MAGKFDLKKAKDGQFFFTLVAGNHEIVGKSEMYKAKASAKNGIESVKKNAPDRNRFKDPFEGRGAKWYFSLKARNGEVILSSQGYSSEDAAESGIGAVKRAADGAETNDIS